MKIDNTTQIENPTITLSWTWQNPSIIVSAKYENERNSYGRQIGQFSYDNEWQWQPNEGNTSDVNEYFKDLAIGDLNIENLTYYQPPTLYGLGVVIPEQYLWAFPNDKFILHGTGFEIPIVDTEHGKAVDVAYLQWKAFLDEIWKPEHKTIFEVLEKVWLYLEKEADAENFIQMPK
jgi:hypothetical protein